MKLSRFALAALAISLATTSSSAALISIESDLTSLTGNINTTLGQDTYNLTVTFAHSHQNVHLILPFAYSTVLSGSTIISGTALPWDNTNKKWTDGSGKEITAYGVNGQNSLVLMSDTNLALTDPDPAPGATAATILSTDSVSILPVGNVVASTPYAFSFQIAYLPTNMPNLVSGSFVVPEPGTLALLGLGGLGVFGRAFRAQRSRRR
jgi:hypothetical protein